VDLHPWTGYDAAIALATDEVPTASPGEQFVYSDINFFLLGDIVARVTGEALELIRQSASDRWRFAGPATIDPTATYRIAVQKILVFNADVYLLPGVVFSSQSFFLEAWELLERFGRLRAATGLPFNEA
jgi:hypothetical protein